MAQARTPSLIFFAALRLSVFPGQSRLLTYFTGDARSGIYPVKNKQNDSAENAGTPDTRAYLGRTNHSRRPSLILPGPLARSKSLRNRAPLAPPPSPCLRELRDKRPKPRPAFSFRVCAVCSQNSAAANKY